MKKYVLYLLLLSAITACNELDTEPDNRTVIDTPQKVKDLLVSAYPGTSTALLFESMSDNVMDNGTKYSNDYPVISIAYRWSDNYEIDYDSPSDLWEDHYRAIAAANTALEGIETLGSPKECIPSVGEALLSRAYNHFILSTVFCRAFNPETSETDLGVPYVTKPETVVSVKYTRGTVSELYKQINDDIEKGLPLIQNIYRQPLYHFNKKAAYAFAARFNLYYGNYAKAIEYATKSLGGEPAFRDMVTLTASSSMFTQGIQYVNQDEPANVMLVPTASLWGYAYAGSDNNRICHSNQKATEETVLSKGPWGSSGLYTGGLFGSKQAVFFSKLHVFFEVTNASAATGFPHVVYTAFTTEETILCRAEAYTMLNMFDLAAKDLAMWYKSKGSTKTYTKENISSFYEKLTADEAKLMRKALSPKFVFTKGGMQENLIHAVLHARRIETIHEGHRWMDIKRWGIQVSHNVDGSTQDLILKPYDLRTAIQIPSNIVNAGVTPSPR